MCQSEGREVKVLLKPLVNAAPGTVYSSCRCTHKKVKTLVVTEINLICSMWVKCLVENKKPMLSIA